METTKNLINKIFFCYNYEFVIKKSKRIIIYFLFLMTNIVFCQNSFLKKYETKDELKSDAIQVIVEFNEFVKNEGCRMSSVPGIKVQTEPFMIKLDKPNNVIIVSYWKDLTNEQKEIFKSWWGDNAEEHFNLMFNWFFIAHELGHYISPKIHDQNPYQCEKEANEVAVTFFRKNPENIERLNFIKESLSHVLEILPKIEFGNLSESEYFNSNYKQIGNDPNKYGYFQIKFVLNALNKDEDFNIKQYFEN